MNECDQSKYSKCFYVSVQELYELAENESKSKTDEIVRLNQELEAVKNDLLEQKEIFRKKSMENDFKIKYTKSKSIRIDDIDVLFPQIPVENLQGTSTKLPRIHANVSSK